MKKMKRILLWQYMLNKRLLHKKSFIILMCMIPLLVCGMQIVSEEESGVLTILLCAESAEDELAKQVIADLTEADSVVRYLVCDEKEALESVQKGEADCAWVFRDDFRRRLDEYATESLKQEAPIRMIAREDNVALQLARTNLYGVIYPHYAYFLCENFLQDKILKEGQVSEAELRADFERTAVEESLFQVVYVNQNDVVYRDSFQKQDSYLLQPVKGLLLVFITICGLASAIYYLQDAERGIFAWIPMNHRMLFACGYHMVAMFDAAIMVFVSLFFLEKERMMAQEIVLLLLYIIICAVFCNFIMCLCRNKQNLGRCIPLLLIAMLVISPIFIDFGENFTVQYLFPPSYYLRALHDEKMYLYGLLYTVALGIATSGINKLMER